MRDLIEQAPMHTEEGGGAASEAVRVPPSAPPSGPPPRAPRQQHGAEASIYMQENHALREANAHMHA
eukprot:3698736-Pyramimonas_sp.AAC.1